MTKLKKVTKKLKYIKQNILSILELKQNWIALIKNFIHVFNSKLNIAEEISELDNMSVGNSYIEAQSKKDGKHKKELMGHDKKIKHWYLGSSQKERKENGQHKYLNKQ